MATPRINRKRKRTGFTLIEIMAAMTVSVLGLIAVTAMLATGMHGTSYARHVTEATVLAEDQLEKLTLTDTANLVGGSDTVNASGLVVSNGGFERTWTVTWDGDLARVAVTVNWREDDGDRSLVFRTVISR